MGLLSALTGWMTPKAEAPSPLDDFWYTPVPHMMGPTLRVTPETAIRVTSVYACVRLLADTVSSLPFIFYRKVDEETKELATDHYLYNLLRHQPNLTQTPFEFWEEVMFHLALRGVFYARLVVGRGEIQELIPLDPDRIKPEKLPNRKLRFRYIEDNGKETIFLQNELYRINLFTERDRITPISPIKACANTVAITGATELYARDFFENGSTPPAVLQSDQKVRPEDRKAMIESWERRHRGVGNKHRIAVLDSGLQFKAISMSNEDSQLLESRQFNLTDICRIYRVPPHMIQDMSRSTFNNIQHQDLAFMIHTIRPWLKRIQQSVHRDLLLPNERNEFFAEHLLNDTMSADSKTRSVFYSRGILDGWLTRNEVRRKENMNPLDGLDEPLQPLNMMTQDEKDRMLENDLEDDDRDDDESEETEDNKEEKPSKKK